MTLHPNEVDFRKLNPTDVDTYVLVALDLGKNYTAALNEQFKRQGVTPPEFGVKVKKSELE